MYDELKKKQIRFRTMVKVSLVIATLRICPLIRKANKRKPCSAMP
jgi:hypothetical protein